VLQDIRAHLRGEWLIGGNHPMRGAKRLARPLFWDVRVIAEFRGGLAARAMRKESEENQTQRKTKNFSAHKQEFTLSDSTRGVKKRKKAGRNCD
jgi:hypothetical protein